VDKIVILKHSDKMAYALNW